MPQYTLKIKPLCLDITIFEFPIAELVRMLILTSIGPLFLIFIISYIMNEKWRHYNCFWLIFFWIWAKIKSFMFCEPPQRKSVFYKEVQKNSAFCPEQAPPLFIEIIMNLPHEFWLLLTKKIKHLEPFKLGLLKIINIKHSGWMSNQWLTFYLTFWVIENKELILMVKNPHWKMSV